MKPKPAPQLDPNIWDRPDAYAIQALQRGDANPDMQKRALKWIIERAAGTYDQSFNPDSVRLSDFAEGRRFVGLQLVKLLKFNLAAIKED